MMSKDAISCETCGRNDETCSMCNECMGHNNWTPKDDVRPAATPEPMPKGQTIQPQLTKCRDPKSRYYDAGEIEVLDVIKAKLTPEQFKGWLLGNLIKYSCRANHKG